MVIPEIRGEGDCNNPSPEWEGVAEKLFFSWFRLNFCVRVYGYSMTLNTNEKILFVFVNFYRQNNQYYGLYVVCQTPKIDNL